jgi:hypothetical protein
MSYWQDMPQQIKNAYTHRLITVDMLNGLVSSNHLNYTEKKSVIGRALLNNKKKRKDIIDLARGENPTDALFGNTNSHGLGRDIAQYIKNSL